MKTSFSASSFIWYLKYFGLPVSITAGAIMCGIYSRIAQRRRRAALNGKIVVITGASSGIGEALAHAFYENGSKVILASRRISELERVKQDLISKNIDAPTLEPIVMELDLVNIGQMEACVQKIYDMCGHIDILINNGGISHRGSILHTKIEVDKQIMSTNYFGSVALTKAALPKMVERRSGHIIFISSVQGLIAIPDRSAYVASKHALQAFGDSLRAEMHQHNVNVTVVSPGYIKTAISVNAVTASGDAHGAMDQTTASGFTPEYIAIKILDAIVKKQNELIVSQFVPRMGIFLRHAAPFLYFKLVARRANKT